jgi:hypothetical protein
MLVVKDQAQVLTEFVDWLNQVKRYHIAQWFDEHLEYANYGGYHRLFAEFFGIDYDEMEREKQAILEYLRKE